MEGGKETMSKEIDEKVVRMQFDNKQFEQNISTSTKSIEKLKSSLNFSKESKSFDSINDASKKVTFDHMSKGIDTVKTKISALQVVGVTALANITNSVVNTGKKFASTIPSLITEGGKSRALNIEQAKFQFKGLGMSVEKSMASANAAVKGTAYGLDSAAKVASQLGASGMKAGDEMTKSLRAVAGVAAMTSSSYDDIGRIFTQVAGQGRLMGDQLLQLSGRGINAAATLAKYLNKSETEVREMVTKGKIDFKTFYQAMDQAFGEHAKDADKTFNGAMSNVKAALSRIGAEFESPKYENLRRIFNALIPVIDNVHESLMPVITDVTNLMTKARKFTVSKLNGLKLSSKDNSVNASDWEKIEKQGIASKTFRNELKKMAKEHGINVDKMIKKQGSFKDSLKNGWLSLDVLNETLTKYKDKTKSSTQIMSTSLKKYKKVADEVIGGKYGTGEERVKALTKAGYDYSTIQSIVNNKLLGTKIKIDKLSNSQLKNIGYTNKQVKELRKLERQSKETGTPLNELISELSKPTAFELMIDSLRNIGKAFKSIIAPVRKAWKETFPKNEDTNKLYSIAEGINNFTKKLIVNNENADKLKRTFKGLFAILDLVRMITGGTLSVGLRLLSNLLGIADINVLDLTSTVGDYIVKLRDWVRNDSIVAKGIKALGNHLVSGTKKIKEWVDKLREVPVVQNGVNKSTKVLKSGVNSIGKLFSTVSGVIDKFINKLKNIDKISFKDITNGFKDFIKNIKTQLKEGTDNIGSFMEMLDEKFGINLQNILKIATAGGILVLIKKISKTINTVKGVAGSLTGVLNTAKDTLITYQKSLKADKFVKLSTAIAILAGSIVVLSLLDLERVKTSAIVLGALAGGLLIMAAVLDKLSGKDQAKITSIMVSLSGGVLMLVMALKTLESVDMNGMPVKLAVLGALMAGLTAVVIGISKFSKNLSKGSLLILSIAVALRIMTGALEKLNGVAVDASTIKNLILVVGALGVLALTSRGINKGAAAAILAITISLRMMIGIFEDIANIDQDKILDNLMNFVLVFGGVSLLLIAVGKAGKNAAKGGVAILATSVALKVITSVIRDLAEMNMGDLVKGGLVIAGIGVMFNLLIKTMKYSGKNADKIGKSLLMISVSIGILVGIIKLTSLMDAKDLIKGGACVVALGLMIKSIINSTKNAKACEKTLLVITGCIAALSGIVYLLSTIEPTSLISPTLALAGITALMYTMVNISKKAGKAKTSMLLTTGCVALLSGCVYMLSTVKPEGIAGAIVAMASIAGVMAVMVEVSKKAKKANMSLILITGIVAALAGVLYLLSDLPVSSVLGTATALSELLLSMTVATTILSVVGATAPGALAGVAALGIVLAGIAGIITIAGGLAQIPGFTWLLNEGTKVLGQIGYAIGNFVGSIVGGIGAGVSSGLPSIGTNLSSFMKNIQPFIEGASQINKSMTEGVKALAETILILTAADLLEGLTSWITGGSSIADFGEDICKLGPCLVDFQKSVNGVDANIIEKSAKAVKSLVSLANELPNTEGFWGWASGKDDLGSFGNKLKPFGEGLVAFSDSVSGVKDFSIISKITKPMKSLVSLANELPNTEGFWGWASGKDDLGSFGEKLVPFGIGLVAFSDSVSGIKDFSIISKISIVFKDIVDLSKSLSEGDANLNNLIGFANILSKRLGPAMVLYSDSLSGVDGSKMINVSDSLKGLQTLAINTVTIDTSGLLAFASALPNVGKSLSSYYQNIKDVDVLKLISVSAGLKSISTLSKSISNGDADGISSFNKSLSALGKSGIDNFIKAFDGSKMKVANAATNMINTFINKANDLKQSIYQKLYSVGSYAVDGFAKGISDNDYKVSAKALTMAKKAADAAKKALDIHSPSRVFKAIGKFTIDGFIKGVDENRNKAINKVAKTFSEVIKGASKEMIAGSKVMKTTVDRFFNEYKKSMKVEDIKKLYTKVSDAVSKYAILLYKESGQYKTDNKMVEEHRKELTKLKKERLKLLEEQKKAGSNHKEAEKQLKDDEKKTKSAKKATEAEKKKSKEIKKNASETKKKTEQIKKDLKTNQKNIKAAKKQLEKDNRTVENNIKATLKSLKTEIADSVKDFTDPLKVSLETGIDLFEKFEKGTTISSKKIIRNMKSQVEGVSKWRDDIVQLGKLGFDQGVIDQLKEAGVSSSNYVRALLKMGKEQISQVNAYYQTSSKLTTDIMMDNWGNQLTKAKQWSENLRKLAEMGFNQDVLEQLGTMGIEESSKYIEAMLNMGKKGIKDFNKKYAKYLKLDNTISEQVVSTYAYAGSEALKAYKKKLSKKEAKSISKNFCSGISAGLKKNTGVVVNASTEVASNVIKAINNRLGIHSPSRVGKEIGKFFDKGLSLGIDSNTNIVENSSENLAQKAINSMKDTILSICDVIESDVDIEPTIRPVLELSDVINGAEEINGLFSQRQAMKISASMNSKIPNGNTSNGETVGNTYVTYDIEQNNYSPKELSRADIYRDTKNLMSRLNKKGILGTS